MRFGILALGLLLSSFLLAQSQGKAMKHDTPSPYMRIDVIDTAYLKASYRYAFHDKENQASSQMALLVGERIQLFQGEDDYHTDSLGIALDNKAYSWNFIRDKVALLPKGRSNIRWRVFTGYPAGKITITDRIPFNDYISEESLIQRAWNIHQDSVKQVMGYTCHLAELELFGRHWYAWYTPEISCTTGPWLLHGLPGMIIQAYDSEHLHEFLLLNLKHQRIPIGFRKKPYYKADRERVVKEYIKFAQDPGKVIFGSGLVKPIGKSGKEDLPKRTYFYIPLRRVTP